jgi:hypothetical protein
MTRIGDLLERDFSGPIEESVKIDNHDPATVFTELTEYVATDRIKAEYEDLFCAMAAAPKSPNEGVGVWISGFFGSGKSSFAKNLGYVLANREIRGAPASSLFLKQVESRRVTKAVEFLNRAVPYEIFMFDVQVELPVEANAEPIAEVMYRVMLRDLDYAEDRHISDLEIELEKEGKLAAFQDLCRAEYQEEWRKIRKDSRKFARSSAMLHRLDLVAYPAADTWLNMVNARPARRLSVQDLVAKLFDLCEIRRPGKTFAFIVDEIGQYAAFGGGRLENLRAVVEQVGKESLARLKAGKIPGPAWIVVTAQEKLHEVCHWLASSGVDAPRIQGCFKYQIDLSAAGIREVAARRVLRKRESQESILRELFRDRGASLMQNVKLERSSRRTEFDEEEFVRLYPYLPHLMDLSIDIVADIGRHPNAPKHLGGGNGSIVKQCFDMLVSDRTRLADQPVGVVVSIDKIYELLEGNIPPEKRNDIRDIRQRFDGRKEHPGMAGRVAKAICLMEFATTDLPRTTNNIAALLVENVTEAPPTLAVAAILAHMKHAQFVREMDDGWKLYDFDDLRSAAAALPVLNHAVGTVNPRLPGWHNDVIQLAKTLLARVLNWHMRPLLTLNASISRSLEEIVWALDRLSMDAVALGGRLAQSEKRSAAAARSVERQLELLHEQVRALAGIQKTANPEAPAVRMETGGIDTGAGNDRTLYVIGLFGTGRHYINELMMHNIGERAKYFRDMIRLHPGPTPMIYSGHATMRYVSRAQEGPATMSRILESVGSGFANLLFVYRHPLDSLLTNWIWWRTYIHDHRSITGISQVYRNTDDLSADLELKYSEFKAFADGDPEFFTGVPGPRFLSFAEFVEETELHLQAATLALRLEDFMADPCKEFRKIVEVMSVDLDSSCLSVAPPRAKPYGYLAVKDKAPRFRNFIDELDSETKRRIEKIGYDVSG